MSSKHLRKTKGQLLAVESIVATLPRYRLSLTFRGVLIGMLVDGISVVSAGELPIPAAALATLGRADQVTTGNKMVINQYTDQAVLNWQSFNIGKDSSVQFKQPGASSVALNRIFQSDPSKIFGKLSANGQVYLVNQNGFVFDRDSQVDVNTLLVSTLDISDDTFKRGITKVINQDGRAALVGSGEIYRKDAQGNYVLDEKGNKQKISIQILEGAKIKAGKNGRIIAAAPTIQNEGQIDASDGQILMVAAKDKVYLQEASGDPSLRGLVVEVQTGGEVTNKGELISNRGNTTLMGFAVNQQGRITANTSVSSNGSIRLLAREGGSAQKTSSGYILQAGTTKRSSDQEDGLGMNATVVLGANSKTVATPDLKDKTTAVDGQTQYKSSIEVQGQKIRVEKNALVQSKSGNINLTATDAPSQPLAAGVRNNSEIKIDPDAVIDVSGVKGVKLPVARNVVEVELRSNELRDAPLQRKGPLYAEKVKVDIRKGTPLADITGALDRIARTVAERSTAGGTLDLNAEGSVSLSAKSKVDFSGGSLLYQGGYVNTSRLVTYDGKTVDIGQADPNQQYLGIVGKVVEFFKDFNQKNVYDRAGPQSTGRYEEGYKEGKSAGSLNIKAAVLDLQGEMDASAVNGRLQRTPAQLAKGGALNIDLTRTLDNNQSVSFANVPSLEVPSLESPAPLVLQGDVLKKSGIMTAAIKTNSTIQLEKDAELKMLDGSNLSLTAGEINLEGRLESHGGNVNLKTVFTGTGSSEGQINLGESSRIDLTGNWNNDRPPLTERGQRLDSSPLRIDGGKLSVVAQGDINVKAGSEMDVSGGAQRNAKGAIKGGNAGTIELSAQGIDGSDLSFEGTALGFAVTGGKGGTLSLASDKVVIGALEEADSVTPGINPLVLNPELFKAGGFSTYNIQSNKSGLKVSDGADVKVEVSSRVIDPEAAKSFTGNSIKNFSHFEVLPELIRPAGELNLKLALNAQLPADNALLTVGQGARIGTDVSGKIGITSDTSILMNGELKSSAGTISLHITPPVEQGEKGFLANQGIWLGDNSKIDATGSPQIYVDKTGRRLGSVVGGGGVSLVADRGFIEMAQTATIDVSGSSGILDLPVSGTGKNIVYQPTVVGSSGGKVNLVAAEGMQLLGNLQGQRGDGTGTSGGTLSAELTIINRRDPIFFGAGQSTFPSSTKILNVVQSLDPSEASNTHAQGVDSSQFGLVSVAADQISSGGFSSLSLRTLDKIQFSGDVSVQTDRSIELNAPVIVSDSGLLGQESKVNVSSAYVVLGSSLIRPGFASTKLGASSLSVNAGLIDVRGESALQGFGQTDLVSESDIRLEGIRLLESERDFLGEFLVSGDLNLTATQIYPSTLSEFKVSLENSPTGTVTINQGAGAASPVLSAAGNLTINAPNIVQGGTLKAPIGTINLNAAEKLDLLAGSVTSNTASGSMIPFGRVQGGLDWIYPLGSQNLVFNQAPAKNLSLNGKTINLEAGSTIDTQGGGDLMAFEFLPGPGGSYDRLDPTSKGYQGSYAVIPGLVSGSAPIDPLETSGKGLKVGDSIYLSEAAGLSAGNYLLLPAHYALLPGAYLITPQTLKGPILPGNPVSRGDGAIIVAGYRNVSGTSIRDLGWAGYAVEPGARAKTRSEFDISYANSFYPERSKSTGAPLGYLPEDGGSIQISTKTGLTLDSTVLAEAAEGGRGGRLDIAADSLNVVAPADAGQTLGGAINLSVDALNGLGVSSITLGALRNYDKDETELDVKASKMQISSGVVLTGKEYILAAKDTVTLKSGATLKAEGEADTNLKTTLRVKGDAALIRVAAGGQADLFRSEVTGSKGSIEVESGATLAANGSMIIDATGTNSLGGSLDIKDGALSLGASRISLGSGAGAGGLVLSETQLNGLGAKDLILSSGSDIGLYGGVNLSAKTITLRTAGLFGFGSAGQNPSISGDTFLLDNRNNVTSGLKGTGSGNLGINAKTMTLGEGSYEMGGFSQVNLGATDVFSGEGIGSVRVFADLNINAPVITGGQGANSQIDASGYNIKLQSPGAIKAPSKESLGARLDITADAIESATLLDLPSGGVNLTALKGNVDLIAGSVIDVSGRSPSIGKAKINTDGGQIKLTAKEGNINLASGGSLLLTGQRAGLLAVDVGKGAFNWRGTVNAKGVAEGGDFDLSIGSTDSAGSLGDLSNRLSLTGFNDVIKLSAKSGDWDLRAGEVLKGRDLSLTAQTGAIAVNGSISAEGQSAAIKLLSAGGLRLGADSILTAQGTTDQGGSILLDTATINAKSTDGIKLDAGARISVGGPNGLANGKVMLVANRKGNDVLVEGNVGNAISGSKETTVDAVATMEASGEIGSAQIDGWKSSTEAFMTNAAGIEARLNLPGSLRAGLSVVSPGDLSLGTKGWDLSSWRYGGRVGSLSLSAVGDLLISGRLSDGFKDNPEGIDLGGKKYIEIKDQLQAGPSWNLKLTAGRDVIVGADAQVRTGTGSIESNAGRDLKLTNDGSAIYTAGRPDEAERYGSFNNQFVADSFYAEYPLDGGDVTLSAGRDVIGALTGQFFDGWMVRTGNWTNNPDHAGEVPTAWGVAIGGVGSTAPVSFRQNVGALGGGNISVKAGHDVTNLSVILPTTGKQIGQKVNPQDATNDNFLTNQVAVIGGGQMTIKAGNDVVGGTFYDAKGEVNLEADGSIRRSGDSGLAPVLALGDSRFNLKAGNSLEVGAALNPTVISDTKSRNYFFTYTPQSGLNLQALAGDVIFQNDTSRMISNLNALRPSVDNILFPGPAAEALNVYPATLDAIALQGDVNIQRSLIMFPSSLGRFRMAAGGDIVTSALDSFVNVTMSDADPALLPSVNTPSSTWIEASKSLQPYGNPAYIHAQIPVHKGDTSQALIYANGSIKGVDPLLFSLPIALDAQSGGDIQDASFTVQHPDYALTTIAAGGNIEFNSPRNSLGNLINSSSQISVAGPGQLLLTAGKNVDLGASVGVFTTGNTVNSALSGEGASVSVLGGMGTNGAQFQAFAEKYDPLSKPYQSLLTSYMRTVTGDPALDDTAAANAYKTLPPSQQNIFLLSVLFEEIRQSASAAAKTGQAEDYEQGYEAIAAMFPGAGGKESTYEGDIRLFFSKISTFAGGDINLLTPGGSVNAGLASAFAGSKSASDLGIVAQGNGAINGMVNNDFMVNQSRVFALNGGDITLWSSNGNIDAGRGAKAALSVPPPQVTFDAQGNLKVIFPPAVSGSGIRTAASSAPKPGDVYLAAPKGIVDAGEAGIGGSNITIAATAVLGANNIQVSGSSTGVPSTNVSVPIAPAGAAAAATAATNTAESGVNNNTNQANEKNALAENRLSPISVDILGYGECGVADIKEGKPGCV